VSDKYKMMSKLKEQPNKKIAIWAMWLGLSTILIFPILGIFTSTIRPIIDRASSENVGGKVGFGIGVLSLILSISALAVGIYAYRKGERSSTLWMGLIPAILTGIFWILMIVGEFIFPH